MRLLTQRLSTARVAMHDARLKADAQMAVVESQARAIAQIEDKINKQAAEDAANEASKASE